MSSVAGQLVTLAWELFHLPIGTAHHAGNAVAADFLQSACAFVFKDGSNQLFHGARVLLECVKDDGSHAFVG